MTQVTQVNPFRKNGSLKQKNTADCNGNIFRVTRRGNVRAINPETGKQWNKSDIQEIEREQ